MSSPLAVRLATHSDYAAMAHAWSAAGESPPRTRDSFAWHVDDYRMRGRAGYFVAEAGRSLVGFGLFTPEAATVVRYVPGDESRTALDLWVHPGHRRRGIGTALLEELLRVAASQGAAGVSMCMPERRESEWRFAEHRHFRLAAREQYFELEVPEWNEAACRDFIRQASASGYSLLPLRELWATASTEAELEALLAACRYGHAYGDEVGARRGLRAIAIPSASAVALREGSLAGTALVGAEGNNAGWLEWVGVWPAHRAVLPGLLAASVRFAREAGFDYLRTSTSEPETADFLIRLGFAKDGEGPERTYIRPLEL